MLIPLSGHMHVYMSGAWLLCAWGRARVLPRCAVCRMIRWAALGLQAWAYIAGHIHSITIISPVSSSIPVSAAIDSLPTTWILPVVAVIAYA